MCKFEFKTYKQKKETVETFEDSVCNGIPKGRRSHSKIRSNFYEKSWKLLFCLCEKNPSQQTEIF